MSDEYESIRSERKRIPANNMSPASIRRINSDYIEHDLQEKARKEKEKKLHEQIGNGKYNNNGFRDRLNRKPSDEDNPSYQDDRVSYHYGYIARGGRAVQGQVWKLEKEEKYDEAAEIGYSEYYMGIKEEDLGALRDYESYMNGYNSAKKESSKGGR